MLRTCPPRQAGFLSVKHITMASGTSQCPPVRAVARDEHEPTEGQRRPRRSRRTRTKKTQSVGALGLDKCVRQVIVGFKEKRKRDLDHHLQRFLQASLSSTLHRFRYQASSCSLASGRTSATRDSAAGALVQPSLFCSGKAAERDTIDPKRF